MHIREKLQKCICHTQASPEDRCQTNSRFDDSPRKRSNGSVLSVASVSTRYAARNRAHPMEWLLLKISCGLDAQNKADVVDTLRTLS